MREFSVMQVYEEGVKCIGHLPCGVKAAKDDRSRQDDAKTMQF